MRTGAQTFKQAVHLNGAIGRLREAANSSADKVSVDPRDIEILLKDHANLAVALWRRLGD